MALNDVPLAGQTLNDTRNPIRNNFLTINAGFAVDHVAFNTPNQGFHNKVTFPVLAVAPVFGGLEGFWSQGMGVTGVPEIWLNHVNGNQYPISASVLSYDPAAANFTQGWTYLASGVVMKWGVVTVNGLTNVDLTIGGPAGGPNFAAVFMAQATPQNATTANVVSLAPAQLQLNSGQNNPVYWFVIGRQ